MSTPQLPLALRFPAGQRLDLFEPADAPAPQLMRALADGTRSERVFLAGPAGSGKSHLLQGACAAAAEHGRSVAYLPLALFGAQAELALQAQTAVDLLCIDALDAACGDRAVELALFALHNRQFDAGGSIVYAARELPDQLPLTLPDLRSRLSQSIRLSLQPLDEAQRRALLKTRATARGLALDDAVLDYLFRRVGRDLGTLTALLDRLDRESLAARRKITVPFLRDLLAR